MSSTDKLPGPCYPNWPNIVNGAFAVHRRSEDGLTCRRCGLAWPDNAPSRRAPTGQDRASMGVPLGPEEKA